MADTKYNQTLARKIYRILWGLAILMVLGGILFFIILSRQDLPTFEELENPENELATVILDKNKNELDRLFIQNRVPVAFEELNPYIVQALISTEDERYYKHAGIDLEAQSARLLTGTGDGAGTLRIVRALNANHFLEVVNEGFLNLTTIYDIDPTTGLYPAVHSRHLGLLGQPVFAQYSGECKSSP